MALVSVLFVIGCIPSTVPSLNPDELQKGLSTLVLDPKVTCQTLADRFGLRTALIPGTPQDLGLNYSEYFVPTPNGEALDVWYVPARLNRGTVVLAYGSSGQMACYLFVTQTLVDLGWSVVMFDYQGFGGSTGTPSLDTLTPDLEVVVGWTRETLNIPQVSLLGVSLGTIPCVSVAVAEPDVVNAVILDSPVGFESELQRFNNVLSGRAAQYAAALNDDLVLERQMPKLTTPMLLILDGSDVVTPPASVQALFDLAPGPKEEAYFPGFGHAFAPYYDTAMYSYRVDLFLSAHWAAGAAVETVHSANAVLESAPDSPPAN